MADNEIPTKRVYPDPGADPVPVVLQGPNEQSIVASGMTVEEWKRKHPRQVLGPAPEEIGQITTDPPDDSAPPTPFPATGKSVDPQGILTAAYEASPHPITGDATDQQDTATNRVTEDITGRAEELLETDPGDAGSPATAEEMNVTDPDENEPAPAPAEPEGVEPEEGDEWVNMTRHAELDEYAEQNDVVTPPEWSSLTIAQKKDFLDDYFA